MNVMTVDGYHARIKYDPELDLFRGEILGLSGGADFYGKNPKELRTEFKKSLQVFIKICSGKGHRAEAELLRKVQPADFCRIARETGDHRAGTGKSINALAQEVLQERVAS